MSPRPSSKLVVVSNRLPCVIEPLPGDAGGWRISPTTGGLVTAMAPVLRDHRGIWIGWPGVVTEDGVNVESMLADSLTKWGYDLCPVELPRVEKEQFYEGFANQILWPLFHSLDERCNFDPKFWSSYCSVNRRFAESICNRVASEAPLIWVHDYHLMRVAVELREMGVRSTIAFFLHTPFPPPNMFLKLPWRMDLLKSLLGFDVLGFQTIGDRRNFLQCVRTLLPRIRVTGRGRTQVLHTATGEVRLGTFPISIDFNEFADEARSEAVQAELAHLNAEYRDRKVILGVDRLDYTKGIPGRLRAFREMLSRYPDLHRKVSYIQVVVPSRATIDEYQSLKEEIEELIGEINGEYTEPGWVPVHYVYRSFGRTELLAFYRRADACLVTPLTDGMNLVAKEYCACNVDESGVLVLSEFAGAAAELRRGAILVNPYDLIGLVEATYLALTMPDKERRARMRKLRTTIRRNNVFSWVDAFLSVSLGQGYHPPASSATAVPLEQASASVLALGGRARSAEDASYAPAEAESPNKAPA